MATINVRDLLRNAKPVFEQMEHDQAPVLITRNGRPFAALVPVDPDHAEAMLLSAAPELIENRNQAQNPGSRRVRLEDLPDLQEDDSQEDASEVSQEDASEVSAEEQPMFDVILESAGEQKIGRIEVVREIVSGLGLTGAQDLLAGALANTGEHMVNVITVTRAYDKLLPPIADFEGGIKGSKVKGTNVVRVGNKGGKVKGTRVDNVKGSSSVVRVGNKVFRWDHTSGLGLLK